MGEQRKSKHTSLDILNVISLQEARVETYHNFSFQSQVVVARNRDCKHRSDHAVRTWADVAIVFFLFNHHCIRL